MSSSDPTPVVIVRRKLTVGELADGFAADLMAGLVAAWIVMLAAGVVVTEWGLSYTDTLLALVVVQLLRSRPGDYFRTTKAKGSAL